MPPSVTGLRTGLRALISSHPQATLILIAFISLAAIYSLVTPPFEAGDESRHYAVIKYMVESGRLPVQNVPETEALQHHWSHEGNQPPLYYALAAILTGWIETGGWDEVFWYNPHTSIGDPLRLDNKNITLHLPTESGFWPRHVLAVRLIRFLSIGMASITVLTAYAIALTLFRGNRRLAAGATAITAFNPMFIFISASVNNDNAVILFVTLALWVMVRVGAGARRFAYRSGGASLRLQEGVMPLYIPALLGLLIGLGALSKLYAFGLLPLAGLLFIWIANQNAASKIRHSPFAIRYSSLFWGRLVAWSVTLGLVFLAVAGWFYIRNAVLYNGDIFALDVMRDAAGQRQEIPSLATLRAEFEGFRIAYWALFGGVNILVDNWIYTILDWVSLLAVLGVIAFIIRLLIFDLQFTPFSTTSTPPKFTIHPSPFTLHNYSLPAFLILLLWYLIMIAGFIVWNLTQPAGQGRLMYPAIAAISALGMLGLTWWLPVRVQNIVAGLCGLGLFLFALLSPWLYIAPAYAKPPILIQADLPADLQAVGFVYDNQIRLIGYQLHLDQVRPAQKLPLTLYWEILAPTDLDYSLFIHLLGRQRQVIGQLDTYPGGGHWPTTLLDPGSILADYYEIPVSAQAEFDHAPTRLRIAAGIYDLNEPGRPGKPAVTATGDPVDPLLGDAKLIPWQWPDPPQVKTPINFFDKATLLSHQIAPDQQTLTLNWRVNQSFETDYTVFIQAWRADTNEYATGFDGPPVQNDYPTSLWAPNEIVVDIHRLDLSQLPPGDYNLLAGLYNPATGERLPTFGAEGPLPEAAVHVGTIRVAR